MNNFDPYLIDLNLIESNDDDGGQYQFELSVYLESKQTYILVVTTYFSSKTGECTLIASGLVYPNITKININSNISIPTTTGKTTFLERILIILQI